MKRRRPKYGKLDRRFTRGKRRPPVKPRRVPRPSQLPAFSPEKGEGHYAHWTELDPKVRRELLQFARRSLGFEEPVLETDYEVTGSVDAVVWDRRRRNRPCVAFEVKSARPWIKDKHARTGRRAGRYQIDPCQHEERLSDSGRCPLYYVLVATDDKAKKVEHTGICSLDMIEEIMEGELTEPRGIHYEAAYECPTARQWPEIRWSKAQQSREKALIMSKAEAKKMEQELEDVPF